MKKITTLAVVASLATIMFSCKKVGIPASGNALMQGSINFKYSSLTYSIINNNFLNF